MALPKKLTVYAAASAIAVVAWVLNVAQLYWMAGALVLLPYVSRMFGLLEHRGLVVSRTLPAAGHHGEAVQVRYRVRNGMIVPKLGLSLADDLPPGLTAAETRPTPVHLVPKGEDEGEYTLQLRRRGLHVLENVRIVSTDMLGLFELESRVPVQSRILVYPRVVDLPGYALPPDLGGGQAPLETAQRKGEGSSFFGIREYRPGDPLKHVHWRTAARLGRLAVIEWEAEQSTDAVLAIETGVGTEVEMEHGSTLDLSAGLAASLAAAVLRAGDSLRVLAPGATEWRPNAERGIEAMPGILESLARMKAISETDLGAALRQIAPGLSAGTLVVVMTPRADEATFSTVAYLRASRLQPVVYALDATPSGTRSPWDERVRELESVQVPVIRLRSDGEITRRILR